MEQFELDKRLNADTFSVAKLGPLAGEMRRLLADPGHVDAILSDGADRAAAIAAPIMRDVKDIVGFVRRR